MGTPPLRVCFIAPKAYPLFNPAAEGVVGGAEVDLYYLATELARDPAFAVSFVCADYGQAAEESWESVRVLRSVDFRRSALAGAWQVWRALRRADAQVYVIKTISAGMFLTATFCRRFRRHFVFRTSNRGSCDGTYLRVHPWRGRLYGRALRGAARVFVQNAEDVTALAATTGVTAQAVPNGHRLPDTTPAAERDAVLWVGRSAAIKAPQRFLDLAAAMPDRSFRMICQRATGDRDYEVLVRRAERLSNLRFESSVPFREMPAVFDRAQVLVNTSDAEGFPNTFIEACLHGVPVLSLAVNPDGFLDTWGCGICCGGTRERLPAALRDLLAPERCARAGAAARRYAAERHDVSRIAESYKDCFRELIAGPTEDDA